MRISTLGDLNAAVAEGLLRRGFDGYATEFGRFLQAAETRIYWGAGAPMPSDPVRVRDMEARLDLTVTAGVATLPADFVTARHLYWPGSLRNTTPGYEPPNVFWTNVSTLTTATGLTAYTIEGNSLYVSPRLTGTANLTYFKRYPALSAAADTNWLLANAPSVFADAMLIEAFRYLNAMDAAAAAHAAYVSTVDGLNATERNSRHSAGPLAPRLGTYLRV